jgi:hypothetical protein
LYPVPVKPSFEFNKTSLSLTDYPAKFADTTEYIID